MIAVVVVLTALAFRVLVRVYPVDGPMLNPDICVLSVP